MSSSTRYSSNGNPAARAAVRTHVPPVLGTWRKTECSKRSMVDQFVVIADSGASASDATQRPGGARGCKQRGAGIDRRQQLNHFSAPDAWPELSRRWRAASNSTTPAATDTLRLST